MRRAMAKVIVERPRIGSSLPSRKKGYRKFLQATPTEDLPRRESMLGLWRGRQRFLNEHLSPMRRFLRSNVGRPWNTVHQELSEHVSFDNAVQKHVLATSTTTWNRTSRSIGARWCTDTARNVDEPSAPVRCLSAPGPDC